MKFSNISNRKLLSTILLYVTATVALVFGKSTFAEWSEFMIWIFGIYVGGNVGEHVSKKIGVKVTPKEEAEQ